MPIHSQVECVDIKYLLCEKTLDDFQVLAAVACFSPVTFLNSFAVPLMRNAGYCTVAVASHPAQDGGGGAVY